MLHNGCRSGRQRRGVAIVVSALLIVVMVAMVAFGLDIGYIVLVRTQLQAAADAAAMAAASSQGRGQESALQIARQYSRHHLASGKLVDVDDDDIEFGIWNADTRIFSPTPTPGNAVRVTTRRDGKTNGRSDLLFARVLGHDTFSMQASAVAMANPRDIAFVIDLSGSMNDDTEPSWATTAINQRFGPEGYPTVGNELMQALFEDFGFGTFPGTLEYLGAPLGVAADRYAYAEMTKDDGPLSLDSIPANYRISPSDTEPVRKQKAYSWVIDNQIAAAMPAAKPTPDSASNYSYWEKYLDYILISQKIAPPPPPSEPSPSPSPEPTPSPSPSPSPEPTPSPTPPPIGLNNRPGGSLHVLHQSRGPSHMRSLARTDGRTVSPRAHSPGHRAHSVSWQSLLVSPLLLGGLGTPPEDRGWLPPAQDSDRIDKFNNPNKSTFPEVSSSAPRQYRNWIGYLTYSAFMLDHGRNLQPDGTRYTPISKHSADCPYHSEGTAGGTFSFPPRTQPMHAARRALIAAMQVIKERNELIPDLEQRDWVSVISFDSLSYGGPVIEQELTGDYDQAMQSCTELQAVGDKGGSTATDAGLVKAREHLSPPNAGGMGRPHTNKIVVLLTDGVPNLYSASPADIDQFQSDHPSSDYYADGSYWYDSALIEAHRMQRDNWSVFPVGVGLGTDYDFMDRLARLGGSADDSGSSPRGSGNPAEYEQRLVEIFEKIIHSPRVRLVQ